MSLWVRGSNVQSAELLNQDYTTWNADAGWSATADTITANATTGNTRENFDAIEGDYYRFKYLIKNYEAGTFTPLIGGNTAQALFYNTSGETDVSYALSIAAGSGSMNGFNAGQSLTCEFQNVSLKHYDISGAGTQADPYIGMMNQDFSELGPGDTLFIGGTIRNNTLRLKGVKGSRGNPIRIVGLPNLDWVNDEAGYLSANDSIIELTECSDIIISGIVAGGDGHKWTQQLSGMIQEGILIDSCHRISVKDAMIDNVVGTGIATLVPDLDGAKEQSTGIFIDGAKITNCQSRGVGLNSDYSVLGNSEVVGNGKNGFNDSSAVVCQGSMCIIENNYMDNNSSEFVDCDYALSIDGGTALGYSHGGTILVRGNIIKNNPCGIIQAYNGVNVIAIGNIIDRFNYCTDTGITTGKHSAVRIGTASAESRTQTLPDSFIGLRNVIKNNEGVHAGSADVTYGYGGIGISRLELKLNSFFDSGKFIRGGLTAEVDNQSIEGNNYYNSSGDYTDAWNLRDLGYERYSSFKDWQESPLLPDQRVRALPDKSSSLVMSIDNNCLINEVMNAEAEIFRSMQNGI